MLENHISDGSLVLFKYSEIFGSRVLMYQLNTSAAKGNGGNFYACSANTMTVVGMNFMIAV